MNSGSIQNDFSTTAEVLVAGLATVDLIARPVELGNSILPGRLVPIERVEMTTGGFVCNVSRALAKLGVRVAVSTEIGDEAMGQFVRSELQAAGIDVAAINQSEKLMTPTTVVLVDQSGERSFLFAAGAGNQLDVEETLRRAAEHPSLRWLLFGYYSLFPEVDAQLVELFRGAKRMGLQTALDSAGHGGGLHPLCEILPWVDCYLPSQEEARGQTGCDDPQGMIEHYRQCGAEGVVGIKQAERGAIVSLTSGQMEQVPAMTEPSSVVDTTGAGDALLAGFIAGQVRNHSPHASLRIAAATAACCVRGLGASSGLQSWEATLELAGIDPH